MRLTFKSLSIVLAPLTFLVFLVMLLIFPYTLGSRDAEKQYHAYINFGCATKQAELIELRDKPIDCLSLNSITDVDEKPLIEGLLIDSNGNRVAIFRDGALEIWPLLDGNKMSKTRSFVILDNQEKE